MWTIHLKSFVIKRWGCIGVRVNVERSRIKKVLCSKMGGIRTGLLAERDDPLERRNWCRGERDNC